MDRSDAKGEFAAELRHLYETSGCTYSGLIAQAKRQVPPIPLDDSTLSGWLRGHSLPRDSKKLKFLVEYLEAAARRSGTYQPRGAGWWEHLRQTAQAQTRARQGRRVNAGTSLSGGSGRLASVSPTAASNAQQTLPTPRQLPLDVSCFTGRRTDLAKLDDLLDRLTGDQATTTVISAVAGTAGVGKTALAIHWAHRIRDRFPDGDLYVNLRGFDPGPPTPPGQVLDGFLRAFDIAPDRIPAGLDNRAGLLRSLLHERRVLLVLDNAASPEQVRPLLPNAPGCLVIVTSRRNLSGLVARDGARRITLDMLTEAEAIALLEKIIGADRIAVEPEAITELARLCVYLPLALRIAAERVAAHAHTSLAEFAGELSIERERLDALATADEDETAAVRGVLSWSYRALPTGPAWAFRLLGLHAGAEIGLPAAAALLDNNPAGTRRVLDLLTDTNLLEEYRAGRYRFHDLLREYAAECAQLDEPDHDRTAAVRRLLAWYLQTAVAASRILNEQRLTSPPWLGAVSEGTKLFTTHAQALAWYQVELDNLVAAVRQAVQFSEHAMAVQLASAMASFFQLNMNFDAQATVGTIGLGAARQLGDRLMEASMLGSLGISANYRGAPEESLDYWEQSMAILRELGQVTAMELVSFGSCYNGVGRNDEAINFLGQALTLSRETGDHSAEGHALECLSSTYFDLQRFDEAVEYADQALTVFRNSGLSYGAGIALARLANAYLALDRFDEAINCGEQSIVIRTEVGDRLGQAWSLDLVANALHSVGQIEAANQYWRRALPIYQEVGREDEVARVRTLLGDG